MFYLKNKTDSFYPQKSLKESATVTATKIAKLQETESLFFNKISAVDEELEEKRAQVQRLEQQIAEKRKRIMLGDNDAHASLVETRTKQVRDTHFLKAKIKQKENKLSHIRSKHNKATARRLELRAEIDAIRREHETLMQIQLNMSDEIRDTEARKNLEANKAEAEFKKVENLKAKGSEHIRQAKTERHQLHSNLENILAKLDKDNHVKKLTRTGSQFASTYSANPQDSPRRHNMTGSKMFEPSGTKKKKGHHYSSRENEKTLEEIDNKLMEYRNTFEELRKVTGKEDIDEICKLFREKEDENYSLFQHVNLLKTDKEALIKLQKELDFEIKKYEDPTNLMMEEKQNEIERLKNELQKKKEKAEGLNEKLKNISIKIDTLKIGIPVIAKRIGCTPEDNIKEARDFRDLSDNDLLQYLSLIEKRTNEILQMYDNCQPKEAKDTKRNEKEEMIDFEARNEELNRLHQDIEKEKERAQYQNGVFRETEFRSSMEASIKDAMNKTKTKFQSNRRGR